MVKGTIVDPASKAEQRQQISPAPSRDLPIPPLNDEDKNVLLDVARETLRQTAKRA